MEDINDVSPWKTISAEVICDKKQNLTADPGFMYRNDQGSSIPFQMSLDGNVSCPDFRLDWTVKLQRWKNDGDNIWEWMNVGTRDGYVEFGSPSERTFTNVGTLETEMRLVLYLSNPDTKEDLGTYKSATWHQ